MSGSLVLLQETTITSITASVTLTGISDSFNVYQVIINDCVGENETNFNMRVTTSVTAQSDSNYDTASIVFKSFSGFGTTTDENEAQFKINSAVGSDSNESTNHIIYLFNFPNSSEFSFYTNESIKLNASGQAEAFMGGGMKTTAEANDGVNFFFSSGDIETGSFQLFALVK